MTGTSEPGLGDRIGGGVGRAAPEAEARALVARALELAPEDLPAAPSIDTVEAWTSIGHMRVILAVEAALGRELGPMEVGELFSLADVAALLAQRDGSASGPG